MCSCRSFCSITQEISHAVQPDLSPRQRCCSAARTRFASLDAKTEDYFFTGFPSYWNIVALYLHVAGLPPAVNVAVLLLFVSLVFVRVGYVYPSRTPVLRGLTVILGVVWGLMVLAIVLAIPDVPRWLWIGSLFFPVYYFMLSFALQVRGRKS